ncbi:MAG: hypothetical protein LUQ68_07610 [Methylococcaceae bacterium]|nr:hypothetical protein [Methylococcaceae bacterium]OYV22214.1 MAG: hypothetical protein CG442_1421 [Methylococcaceae bacterium NSO1]
MSNLKNNSRRRFLAQSGLGLMAFAGMPGFLRAMEGMQGMQAMATICCLVKKRPERDDN